MNKKLSLDREKIPYEKDYYGWAMQQAKLLKEGKLDQIDVENLIEEVESMGKSERRELKSRLKTLIVHVLKWNYQPKKRSRSWLSTIHEQRKELNDCIQENPSLRPLFKEMLENVYPIAVNVAERETKFNVIFPEKNPFSVNDLMHKEYSLDQDSEKRRETKTNY